MAADQDPDDEQQITPESPPPPLPPYAPDPRFIDLMERGADMTDEEVRRVLRHDSVAA